jgi:hypothetical protein
MRCERRVWRRRRRTGTITDKKHEEASKFFDCHEKKIIWSQTRDQGPPLPRNAQGDISVEPEGAIVDGWKNTRRRRLDRSQRSGLIAESLGFS